MKDNYLKICEVFDSISGEGLRAGMPATFIRFSGCNLTCDYCDTKYHTEIKYVIDIMNDSKECVEFKKLITGKRFVILTGGEPGIQDLNQLYWLIQYLHDHGTEIVEIETNSSNLSELMDQFKNTGLRVHYSADFKLNYKDDLSYVVEALTGFSKLTPEDCIKVVVSDYTDIEYAVELADKFANTNVIVSPCYEKISPTGIAKYLVKCGYQNVRMQIQLHKVLWEADKRGV